jgi:hypothetical protein
MAQLWWSEKVHPHHCHLEYERYQFPLCDANEISDSEMKTTRQYNFSRTQVEVLRSTEALTQTEEMAHLEAMEKAFGLVGLQWTPKYFLVVLSFFISLGFGTLWN